jgi:hypothetical protein
LPIALRKKPPASTIIVQIESGRFATQGTQELCRRRSPRGLWKRVGEKARFGNREMVRDTPATPSNIDLAIPRAERHEWVDKGVAENCMQMETKYLRLRTEVALGSWFDDWEVCWLGGWAKHRPYYLVMLVRVPKEDA